MHKTALVTGSFFAALAVILGAFGAHALKAVLTPEQLVTFETGVRYQVYHSFALLAAGIIHQFIPVRMVRLAVAMFITGVVLFSGSLYALTIVKANGQVGIGGLGLITPVGGVFFILGWVFLLIGCLKKSNYKP
ncbi:MAG: DUF423 domain-containing protein [Sphingobacteriales bacterium]|nr:MAG: DUF423 domain-containing protein [Sphingobacteriales bacterium]